MRDWLIERVPNNQFLQRDSVPEAQTSCTEPPYRTRRDFQDPVAIAFHPQLGMERAMKQAERVDRPLRAPSPVVGELGRDFRIWERAVQARRAVFAADDPAAVEQEPRLREAA